MQSGSGTSDAEIIAGINVTPLVDITLVLLVIFIVTAKIFVTPAVPLDLPRAVRTDEVQVVFSVIVPARGTILVDGAPAAGDRDLGQRAKAAVQADPNVRAVIQADTAVSHGVVLHLLDVLREAGLERVAFAAAAMKPETASGDAR